MKVLKLIGLLSVLILLLFACDNGEPPTEPIAQFPQTITDITSALSVSYPEGWVASASSLRVNLANNQQALDTSGQSVVTGQTWGTIFFVDNTQIGLLNLQETPTPRNVLDGFVNRSNDQTAIRIRIDERETYVIGSNQAIVARGTTDTNGIIDGVVYAVVQVRGGFVFFTFRTEQGETEQFISTIRAITTTVSYAPPAANPTPTAEGA